MAYFAQDGCLDVPKHYAEIADLSTVRKFSKQLARLPHFIRAVNREAGYVVCDNQKIYIKNPEKPTVYESAVILATHTGNTSLHSFAAEVEYHARFLSPLVKIKIPFLGRSVYDSAIRADMSIGDAEFQGTTPYYRPESKIVKRQCALHQQASFSLGQKV